MPSLRAMDEPEATDLPAFDLPDWGEEGAPPVGGQAGEQAPDRPQLGPDDLVVTTTDSLEGAVIRRYLGVVAGEASVSIGSRGAAASLREARAVAMDLMRSEAVTLGASAVVGARLEVVIRKGDVLALATGTAVATG